MKLKLLAEGAAMPNLQTAAPFQRKTGMDWNKQRPSDAPPLPPILSKEMVEDVEWDAPGRKPYFDEKTGTQQMGDPRIGAQINGVRKTKGGYAYKGWWYVLKLVHRKGKRNVVHGQFQGVQRRNIYYWYRRRREKVQDGINLGLQPANQAINTAQTAMAADNTAMLSDNEKEGKIVEQYIGKVLKDKDTGMKIIIPEPLKDEIDRAMEKAQHEEERAKLEKKRAERAESPILPAALPVAPPTNLS